jgi:pyridoxal phosphate enzyme (YggS family)
MTSAAERSGRDPRDIALMGVSKFQPIEAICAAFNCGLKLFGENRVQEREEKSALWTGDGAVWHMIGHLQRNKVRKAVALFDCIESVDSVELADSIERIISENIEVLYPILIEVNVSGESSKEGVPPEVVFVLLEDILERCPHLTVEGFMTIGPNVSDRRAIRESFVSLRNLRDEARKRFGIPLPHLSMGMSGDYEIAIEEGSTIVRVGTGIFGLRH